jgi:hypothetical protein
MKKVFILAALILFIALLIANVNDLLRQVKKGSIKGTVNRDSILISKGFNPDSVKKKLYPDSVYTLFVDTTHVF